jgi:hypothetical protein
MGGKAPESGIVLKIKELKQYKKQFQNEEK